MTDLPVIGLPVHTTLSPTCPEKASTFMRLVLPYTVTLSLASLVYLIMGKKKLSAHMGLRLRWQVRVLASM